MSYGKNLALTSIVCVWCEEAVKGWLGIILLPAVSCYGDFAAILKTDCVLRADRPAYPAPITLPLVDNSLAVCDTEG
jgi:hypothetical protein